MRRLDLVLGFALFVILAAVITLGMLFWQQSRLDLQLTPVATAENIPSQGANSVPGRGETALMAYGVAQNQALAWESEATLLTATSLWPLVATPDQLRTAAVDWHFSFYDPNSQQSASVSVVKGQATLGGIHGVAQRPRPLSATGWRINSDMAINLFLLNGGQEFIGREADATISMQLSTIAESQRMEWLISAFANRSRRTFTMYIDASTGEILNIEQGQ